MHPAAHESLRHWKLRETAAQSIADTFGSRSAHLNELVGQATSVEGVLLFMFRSYLRAWSSLVFHLFVQRVANKVNGYHETDLPGQVLFSPQRSGDSQPFERVNSQDHRFHASRAKKRGKDPRHVRAAPSIASSAAPSCRPPVVPKRLFDFLPPKTCFLLLYFAWNMLAKQIPKRRHRGVRWVGISTGFRCNCFFDVVC